MTTMGPSSKLAQRESVANSAMASAPKLPLLAIRGYLCFRCLEHKEKLSRCRGCQRAVYCSKDCQLSDWRLGHRAACKILQAINEIEKTEESDKRSWVAYTNSLLTESHLVKASAAGLGTAQADELAQVVAGQPYCIECHLSRNQLIDKGATLKACTTCHLAASCSRCPVNHSEDQCHFWQLVGWLEQFRLDRFEKLENVLAVQPVGEPFKEHRPLASYEDWSDFFSNVPVRALAMDDTMEEPLHQLTATDSSTISITILAALEASVPDITSQESITLHLVGATNREAQHLMLFEDILHVLPHLKHLNVVLCGPGVPALASGGPEGREIDLECCPPCHSMGRKRTVALFTGTYHDYARRPAYRKPDLAVLFHSGRSQEVQESWAPTTRYLVDSGIRTLCTTYTEREATEETEELNRLGAKFIVRPEENKWRGLCPFPELLEGKEHTAYYMNYYWYIFQGKTT